MLAIKIKVRGADSVEFYLRRPESLVPQYIGIAEHKNNNIWEMEFNTQQVPNGKYNIFPKLQTNTAIITAIL